jgi:hypothetical protein
MCTVDRLPAGSFDMTTLVTGDKTHMVLRIVIQLTTRKPCPFIATYVKFRFSLVTSLKKKNNCGRMTLSMYFLSLSCISSLVLVMLL